MSENEGVMTAEIIETEIALDVPVIETEHATAEISMHDIKGEKGEITKGVDEEELNVIGFDSSISPGQHYIIVSRDGDGLGHEVQVEPPTKKLRTEDGEGQFFVLTVKDGSEGTLENLASGFDFESTQVAKTSSTVRLATIPPKKSISDSDVSQAWFTTRDDKVLLQSKGASWKQGQWTKEEVEILQNNIQNYCKERNINDPTEIIFEMTKDERKDFYRTIARDLQRPLFSVYRRVTRMYDQKNHIGKYTPEEMAKLRDLRMHHGNDWSAIGSQLGRSASSVKDKCRLMKDTCNSGKWLPEEEKRLSSAVYELAGAKPGESVTHGLSWAIVAEQVSTRSEKQCRTKWLNFLNWKQKGGAEWTREDDINLIVKISNLDVNNETEIDWEKLSTDWPSVRSPQWLRGKWWSMKRHVPDYQHRPFSSLVYYLKTMALQNVRLKNPVDGNLRLARLDMPQPTTPTDMTLHIPVTLQAVDRTEDDGTLQAYEVLQHLTPTSSGTFLITQPHNSQPAISLSGANMATDHIIVHTLSLNQAGAGLGGNENVAVQLNPQPHVIISSTASAAVVEAVASLDEAEITNAIQLTTDTTSSGHALHSLTQVTSSNGDIEHEDISEQVISTVSSFDTQDITEASITSGEGESEIVCSTAEVSEMTLVTSASPNFVQSGSNDGELMSSLSDPMLTSEATDLIGSCSDVEGDKGHVNENEHDLNDINDT